MQNYRNYYRSLMLPVSLSSENTTEDLKWTSSEASGRVCSKCSELSQASGGYGQGWRTFWTFHTTAICLLLSDLTLASSCLIAGHFQYMCFCTSIFWCLGAKSLVIKLWPPMIKDVNKICKCTWSSEWHWPSRQWYFFYNEDTAVKIGPKILSWYGTNGIILCAVILYLGHPV